MALPAHVAAPAVPKLMVPSVTKSEYWVTLRV